MNEEKNRHTVWLTDEAWNQVKGHYQGDNCSTQNEYIEKAIRFYSGYLDRTLLNPNLLHHPEKSSLCRPCS